MASALPPARALSPPSSPLSHLSQKPQDAPGASPCRMAGRVPPHARAPGADHRPQLEVKRGPGASPEFCQTDRAGPMRKRRGGVEGVGVEMAVAAVFLARTAGRFWLGEAAGRAARAGAFLALLPFSLGALPLPPPPAPFFDGAGAAGFRAGRVRAGPAAAAARRAG